MRKLLFMEFWDAGGISPLISDTFVMAIPPGPNFNVNAPLAAALFAAAQGNANEDVIPGAPNYGQGRERVSHMRAALLRAQQLMRDVEWLNENVQRGYRIDGRELLRVERTIRSLSRRDYDGYFEQIRAAQDALRSARFSNSYRDRFYGYSRYYRRSSR